MTPFGRLSLCLSLHNCGFERADVLEGGRAQGLPFGSDGLLQLPGAHLTVHVN